MSRLSNTLKSSLLQLFFCCLASLFPNVHLKEPVLSIYNELSIPSKRLSRVTYEAEATRETRAKEGLVLLLMACRRWVTQHRRSLASKPRMAFKDNHRRSLSSARRMAFEENVTNEIEVYDNVLSRDGLRVLNENFGYPRLEGVYHRSNGPRSATEQFIESILSNIGDDSPEIEYWFRDHWTLLEAHRDCDDGMARSSGVKRFPRTGHVTYIEVEPELRAPTVLWRAKENNIDEFVVVPAVEGRLLRFAGSLLHAVPCPAHQILSDSFAKSNQTHVRRALLFNSWTDGAPVLDGGDSSSNHSKGPSVADDNVVRCLPKDSWHKVPLQDPVPKVGPYPPITKIMTGAFGLDIPFISFALASPDLVARALESANRPSKFPLHPSPDSYDLGLPSQVGPQEVKEE